MFIIIIARTNKSLFYCINSTKLICFHVGLGGGACIRQGVFVREGCRRRGIY